jgi:alpha-tubulin suppressor-like RCC1 family protein
MKINVNAAFVIFLVSQAASQTASAMPEIRCWGNNGEGQNTVPASLKVRPALVGPLSAHTSKNKTCVLDKTGKVTCYGLFTPDVGRLQALTGVTSFSTSVAGSCATNASGVQCFSALGDPSFEKPPTLEKPKAVVVGGSFACALDANGVSCWGDDSTLQTGVEQIPTLKNPKKLFVGVENACAIDDTGVQCWGGSDFGITQVPTTLSEPTDLIMGLGFACAQDKNGLECWGSNNGTSAPTVPAATGAITYVSGQAHICGLSAAGVQCWGDNTFRQLDVPALSRPSAIFADVLSNQTCAINGAAAGLDIVCWGEDSLGQSSLPAVDSITTGESNTCAVVQGQLSCWGKSSSLISALPPITDAYKVVIGSDYACDLDIQTSEKNACWGDSNIDSTGSLTLPSVDYTTFPNNYSANVSVVAAGFHHACSATTGGTNVATNCWGNNDFGQTKLPTNFTSTGLPGSLAAGGYHTCGIDATQGLLCWGKNQFGQITVPTTLKNPRQVSAGFGHTCALDDNGVTCWGRSTEGQTLVPLLQHPRLVQAGGYHTCALDDTGVHCWGEDSFGQSTVPNDLNGASDLSVGLFNTCVVTR